MNTDDYRNAPSGEGPLSYQWSDKPHRLVYDLCTEVERLTEAVTNLMAENGRLTRQVDAMYHAAPAMMSTPDGLLPINSDGMRHCVDKWVEYRYKATGEISSGDALRIALGIE